MNVASASPVSFTRSRTPRMYNMHLLDDVDLTAGGMPILHGCGRIPDRLIAFSDLATHSLEGLEPCAHFFLDDYRFERVWRTPEKYLPMLQGVGLACAPDFSLYADMPLPLQRWNVYRSRLLAAWWHTQGINVIPTLQYSTQESYGFAFDGLPEHSVVATSTIGTTRNATARNLWRLGMDEAIRRLNPSCVLVYGNEPDSYDWHGTRHITYTSNSQQRFNQLHNAGREEQ